jgi:hypothetical protein
MTLAQLNLGSRQGLAAAAAASAAAVSSEVLDGIRELRLVSAAAAAVPHVEAAAEEEEGQQDGQAEGSDDEFEEYGAGSDSSRQQQRRQRQQQQDEGPDGASHAPEGFTAAVALAQLQALRSFSKEWMTLLCRVYIDVSGFCSCFLLLLCIGGTQQTASPPPPPRRCMLSHSCSWICMKTVLVVSEVVLYNMFAY